MSPPALEHDYIGLSEASSVASSDNGGGIPLALNLKETELRLGPPGSGSPDRKDSGGKVGLTLGLLPHKATFFSGAKRGFSDAIDGNGKWAFSGGTGSEVELGKGAAVLFSPKGETAGGGGQNSGPCGAVVMDAAAVVGQDKKTQQVPSAGADRGIAPAAKAQVVGWPPIRSYRKNTMATNTVKNKEDSEVKQGAGCLYVKVSMDGAPYLRKVDLKTYYNYKELSLALEKMFSGFTIGQYGGHGIPGRDGLSESRLMDLLSGSEYVVTYEDRDGDWMLVGDVPWEMFTDSCRRLRIMKGSDAIGLAPRAMEKCKNRH